MQAHIIAEILQQAEQPVVLLVTLRTPPDGRNTEHGATFREEVQNQQVTLLHPVHHLRPGILRPALYHPHSLRVHGLHGLHQHLPCTPIVNLAVIIALMERVHRVIVSLAEEPGQFLIVDIGNLTETLISGQQVGRSLESVPQSGLSHIQSQPLPGIMGHHSAIARQYGMHAQFLHALQDLFLQLLLTVIPGKGQRATPPLQVVHLPPGQEGRTGDKLPHFLLRIAQTE